MNPDTVLIPIIETKADRANILSKPQRWIKVVKCTVLTPPDSILIAAHAISV